MRDALTIERELSDAMRNVRKLEKELEITKATPLEVELSISDVTTWLDYGTARHVARIEPLTLVNSSASPPLPPGRYLASLKRIG